MTFAYLSTQTRFQTYSDKPASELNEDQKKTLLTLPTLEAIRKELEETKKAVEVSNSLSDALRFYRRFL